MIHPRFINRPILFTALCCILLLVLYSCDSSSTDPDDPEPEIEANTVEDVFAQSTRTNPNAEFVYFSLKEGTIVASEDSASAHWDIAFRGTDVIVNSGSSGPGEAGAIMLDIPFEQVEIAPSDGYRIDSEEESSIEGNGGWYTYTGSDGNPPHSVLTKDDVTIVLKTADGNHYAKLEMLSYYKGNPEYDSEEFLDQDWRRENGAYYTFRYAIQQTEGLRELQ